MVTNFQSFLYFSAQVKGGRGGGDWGFEESLSFFKYFQLCLTLQAIYYTFEKLLKYKILKKNFIRELSFWHKLRFFNPHISICCRPLIFQTIDSARSNNLCLKYQRCTSSGSKDKEITKISVTGKNLVPLAWRRTVEQMNNFYWIKLALKFWSDIHGGLVVNLNLNRTHPL